MELQMFTDNRTSPSLDSLPTSLPRIVKLTPEQIGKYLSFAKHLDAPAISNAFVKVVLTGGDGLGGVRDIYLKGLAPGQFVREM